MTHWGIWIVRAQAWMRFGSGEIFWTTSTDVALAQLRGMMDDILSAVVMEFGEGPHTQTKVMVFICTECGKREDVGWTPGTDPLSSSRHCGSCGHGFTMDDVQKLGKE